MCSLRSVVVRKFISQRCFHTTQVRRIDPKTVEEIKIPVPWGHIAGKKYRLIYSIIFVNLLKFKSDLYNLLSSYNILFLLSDSRN